MKTYRVKITTTYEIEAADLENAMKVMRNSPLPPAVNCEFTYVEQIPSLQK